MYILLLIYIYILFYFIVASSALAKDDFFENDTRAELFQKTDYSVPSFKITINDDDYKKLFLKVQCEEDMDGRNYTRNDDCYTTPWVNLNDVMEKAFDYKLINKSHLMYNDLEIIKNKNITLSQFERIVTRYTDEPLEKFLSIHNLIKLPSDDKESYDYKVKKAKLTFELEGDVKEFSSVTFSIGGKSTRKFGKQGYNIKLDKKSDLYGRRQIRLRAESMDPSLLRDKLSYDICNALDLPTLSANYAKLYINGKYMGFYLMRDAFKANWVKQNFGDESSKNLYTCDKKYGNSTFFNCVNDDEDNRETDTEFKTFIQRLEKVKTRDELEEFFDTKTFIKWQVVKYLIAAWDHVNYRHNVFLYLYHDKTNGNNKWIPLLYDFDNTFGEYFTYDPSYSFYNYFSYNQEFNFKINGVKYNNTLFDILELNKKDNQEVKDLIREVMIKVFNPKLLFSHADKLRNFIDPYVKVDRTYDESNHLPGVFKRKIQYREDHFSYDDFLANSEYTPIYLNESAIKDTVIHGIKEWIIDRFRNSCRLNNINCSFGTEYLNRFSVERPDPIKYDYNYMKSGYKKCTSENPEMKVIDVTGNALGLEDHEWCFIKPMEESTESTCGEYNFKCCSSYNTNIEAVDSTGLWSIELGKWCIMKDKKKEKKCRGLSYPCCSNKTSKIILSDKDGDWALENNAWCLYTFEIKCWSENHEDLPCCGKFLYNCCKNTCKLVAIQDKIQLGIENGEYCSIPYSCFEKKEETKTKTTTITTTTTKKSSPTNNTRCAHAYEPCGGINYPNSPTCCETGYYCETKNKNYHQCYPITHYH
ncbi:coth-domain-containing protein [Anaeromyces robustus]|uniref:Coth-domain-containing protein n=1 Tax=Anaeromyces robustus TaxID=1754192 RepID=A0A1Y1XG04_9FUNG|nr:coth-domain-containing protein [Anaeromyces robustus]|eukprot:ORX84657.1 coth-domain-containing protein [Anaeromyces robustus]